VRTVLLSAPLVCAIGCGGQTATGGLDASADGAAEAACTLSISDYATSCTKDGDCVAVFMGNACDFPCFCPNATIASSEQARYESDFAATGHGGSTCFCPPDPTPLCCHGACTIAGCDGGP
jgi:hypothetical protein